MAQTPTTYDNRTGEYGPHGTIEGWTPRIGMTVTVFRSSKFQTGDLNLKGEIVRLDWNGTMLVETDQGDVFTDLLCVTTH